MLGGVVKALWLAYRLAQIGIIGNVYPTKDNKLGVLLTDWLKSESLETADCIVTSQHHEEVLTDWLKSESLETFLVRFFSASCDRLPIGSNRN